MCVSADAMTTHIMKDGDTLWGLAQKYYGDGTLYTILSKYNNISNPRTIPNGKKIMIPDKTTLQSFKEGKIKPESELVESNDPLIGNLPKNEQPSKNKELTSEDLTFENKLNVDVKPVVLNSENKKFED